MKSALLLAGYFAIGASFAVHFGRREGSPRGRATAIALALVAWPLWAPIASFSESPSLPHPMPDVARRIELALDEALAAIAGSPLSALLPERSVLAMKRSVALASSRVAELENAVSRGRRESLETRRRIERLEGDGTNRRALATARVHLENLEKLESILGREREALLDFADLCDALRAQLVLARYAGSSLDGVGEIVEELGARIEGLDSALAAVVSDSTPT